MRVECLYALRANILRKRIEKPPVIITGCGHSGTTLLLSILDAHSRIFSVPYEARPGKSSLPELREKIESFNKLALAHGKSRWIEKATDDVFYIGHLFDNIPGLRIVVMVRDGRDVVCSMKVRWQQTDGSESAFAKGLNRWTKENLQWLKHQDHSRVLMVKYEELVKDLEPTITTVLGFLGEGFEPAIMDFHLSNKNYLHQSQVDTAPEAVQRNIKLFRNWQVHQPIFDGSGRWKSEMSENEKSTFKETVGELLIRLGYVHDLSW